MEGIHKVETDRYALTATVEFDPQKTDPDKMNEALVQVSQRYAATVQSVEKIEKDSAKPS
ncbi:MAG: hypothetical protein MUC92_06420 [Fimbriimonadaceae bacterium]|nr:hypothetical protein [Fimbriimonadaceae bacterium]